MMRLALSLLLLASCAHGDPCDCEEGPWVYQPNNPNFNITYDGGCTATKDWPNQAWCYVQNNTCIHGIASTVVGETRNYKTCSPCNCRGMWDYNGSMFTGCKPDPAWGAWCYVQGSTPNCDDSMLSTNPMEVLRWRNCNTCECMNNWNYNGTMQHGCYNDLSWGSQWCYVEGYSNCATAAPSQTAGERRYWRNCPTTTTCGAAKQAYKDSNCCGNPSGTFTAP